MAPSLPSTLLKTLIFSPLKISLSLCSFSLLTPLGLGFRPPLFVQTPTPSSSKAMVAGSQTDGGNQAISFRVRKIIQSIKEIVGNHSDSDIYAVLKASNMDPYETAQKLLNQDPFHEVKREKEKKKELTGHKGSSDNRRHLERDVHPANSRTTWDRNSRTTWDRNVRRGGYSRNSASGISREFRVVRDNRVKQNANADVKTESVQHIASGTDQVKVNFPEKCVAETLDQKHQAFSNSAPSQCVNKPCVSSTDGRGHKEDVGNAGTLGPSLLEKSLEKARVTNSQPQTEDKDDSRAHPTSTSTNSVIGMYSSSSDPVHVPSPDSKLAGSVGAIRRELGVVGVRKQSSNHPASDLSVSNSSFSVPLLTKDVSSPQESFGQSVATSDSSQLHQSATSKATVPTVPASRAFSGSQHNSKMHQQPIGHQKAMQSTMEWKPKSNQKPPIISPNMAGTAQAPTLSHSDRSSNLNPDDVAKLSEKLSQVNILQERHVIIPQHLRVPESERALLTFGSFEAGFYSTKVSLSVSQAFDSAEHSRDEPSVSVSGSVPMGSGGDASADDQENLNDCPPTTRSDSPVSAAESEQAPPGNGESSNNQTIENYADIGLVQDQSPSYTSSHTHQLQIPTSLPSFSAYNSQTSYDGPLLRIVMDDNSQRLTSSTQAVSSNVTSSAPPSTVAFVQQQQQQQQQPPIANMYPQVHISQFPNFMPYRHIFSPVYGPPMAMPNYSSNPAYTHPSNGSSYLVMPGGSSHVTASGMKYAGSQYKPVAAVSPAYGNYGNPTGFTISPPGSVGSATGLEDATRIKYKDNNLFVPNPQAETKDIWIPQTTPRELQSMQTAPPYYNLTPPAAAVGHAPFNAAQPGSHHVQYPSLYHAPASPATMASAPHHLVHQSGLGGVAVAGAAAPGPQVGAYQQPQLGHVNWPVNF